VSAERVLASRYEVGRCIGRGGMAEVFAAHDRVLDREVAIKLLRDRFRDDAMFTSRFEDEARNVAKLSHPNLVVVFDTGSEDDQPYIVMERIRGRTLQEALDAGGLTEDRSLQVAADVCGALAYAHRNLLVHRDIKPGNIMLSEDGSVKVTDFGIARAISDETVTRTAAVLGTAAYLSPEQAQGQRVDARSDLYSLGVVLYELLTGKVPFSGDSAVSVALQHVRATPEPPRRLAPAVSRAAETICLRLLEKDPERRYQQAEDVRVDLERARRGEPPLPLRPAAVTRVLQRATAERDRRGAGTRGSGADDTLLVDPALEGPGPAPWGDDAVTVVGVAVGGGHGPSDRDVPRASEAIGSDPRLARRGSPQRAAGAGGASRRSDADSGTGLRIAAYLGLVAVVIGVVLGARALLTADPAAGPDVTVPQLVGAPVEDVQETLTASDLRLGRIIELETEASAPGTVVAQRPAQGEQVAAGSAVDVTVAKSPQLTTVPNVAGLSEEEALRRLREAGLVPGTRTRAASDILPSGTVIGTLPGPGTRVAVESVIEVTISDGPARAAVRAVTNRPLAEAVARLRDQGFVVEIYEEANPAVAAGLVIRQVPAAGEEAVLGSTVMLWVSTGPFGEAPVPDVPDPDPAPDGAPDGDGADGGESGGG
jgi:eukaryotic-like serine/threonine-protein kinase